MSIERIRMLEEFIRDDPSDSFSRYALALEYVSAKDLPKALLLLENLKADDPAYLPLYYQSGMLNLQLGRNEEAVKIFREGIKLANEQGNRHTLSELQMALDDLEYS